MPSADLRVVAGINPAATIAPLQQVWQAQPELLRDCDLIFVWLDRYADRDQLERLARRFLIPYIDIGMDVHAFGERFLISGQVVTSLPGQPCLWCMALLTEVLLTEEARRYGAAGGRPQVIWPNGILASTAVGIFMQLVTPWHSQQVPILLEYDGNAHTVTPSNKLLILNHKVCHHFSPTEVGDPFFASQCPPIWLQQLHHAYRWEKRDAVRCCGKALSTAEQNCLEVLY